MAAIDQYIKRIPNAELQEQLRIEIARLTKKKRFGLVFENHLPDNVVMPEVTIRRGTKVALRGKTPNDVYEVQSISEGEVTCALVQDVESEMARQLTTGIDTRTARLSSLGYLRGQGISSQRFGSRGPAWRCHLSLPKTYG